MGDEHAVIPSSFVEKAKYSKRVIIKSILGREDGGLGLVGQVLVIGGWVKTGREQGKGTFAFLEVNDGSCFANIQVTTCFTCINDHYRYHLSSIKLFIQS
jgi:aspartyl/asparaginyl-tRNA synthetase